MSHRAQLRALCREHDLWIMYAFGSRAAEVKRWLEDDPVDLSAGTSDVDIGVLPAEKLHVHEKVEIAVALEDLLNVHRVDLVVPSEADPFVAAEVIRGKRLFADDEDAADEYDLYVLRRAGDLLPFEKERIEMILGRSS
ncbi:MAG: nucleotidyltransferase domain-containing protein [Anaerolineae bacterium]